MGSKNRAIPHRYTLVVHEIRVEPTTTHPEPYVVIEHHGPLSARAKRQITEALADSHIELQEVKRWLA